MKKQIRKPNFKKAGLILLNVLGFTNFSRGPALAAVAGLILTSIIVISSHGFRSGLSDLREFEVGKVADRDVVVEKPFSFVDEAATRLRIEAQERLVPAVFRFNSEAAEDSLADWEAFFALSLKLFQKEVSLAAFALAVQAEYPGEFSGGVLEFFYSDEDREKFGEYGSIALKNLYERGVCLVPRDSLGLYNPDTAEVLLVNGTRTESEHIHYSDMITMENAVEALNQHISGGTFPPAFALIAGELLQPFIRENVFFSEEDTRRQVAGIRVRVEPVVHHFEQGEQVIRKDFIITEENMRALRALNQSLPGQNPRLVAGHLLLLFLVFRLLVFLGSRRITGRHLEDPEVFLIIVLSTIYLSGAAFAACLSLNTESFPVSILMPTALLIMLPAILVSPRLALVLGMALPLGAWVSGSFDAPALIFALVSAVSASYSLEKAENRMDIIKTGLFIAAVNCVAAVAILLTRWTGFAGFPPILFWAAFNGLASGMLVMGFLPVLEQMMNAATTFRLRELSDLNSPALKKLFAAAPGTYSHSIMVANLAEAACQDIGANALLARVGAYYHDLGKMEQSEYFVENQRDYNPHDDLAPRLSATIIRSHVRIGLEKARQLGLPRQVQDIIVEHHGNSLISWFYDKALKQEKSDSRKKSPVSAEDFSYPGTPPRSRESAVVMLADVTEAAVRTLKKPTVSSMEKYIRELFNNKVEHGQLSRAELTFKDLETIKNAFVRVLAGHYHSRIEYPKLPSREQNDPAGGKTDNNSFFAVEAAGTAAEGENK
ncbi:MAG: HDIG domain-containing protein [Treponema sp.]|jgi:putative nucleotidyltransferase with HDIG domain|nr:HDIG domain-containing protein [Treponema sp.]